MQKKRVDLYGLASLFGIFSFVSFVFLLWSISPTAVGKHLVIDLRKACYDYNINWASQTIALTCIVWGRTIAKAEGYKWFLHVVGQRFDQSERRRMWHIATYLTYFSSSKSNFSEIDDKAESNNRCSFVINIFLVLQKNKRKTGDSQTERCDWRWCDATPTSQENNIFSHENLSNLLCYYDLSLCSKYLLFLVNLFFNV